MQQTRKVSVCAGQWIRKGSLRKTFAGVSCMDQTILKMEHINKSFGNAHVLKDVHFELRQGEVHALVGGNGADKSTLMKIMTGVYSKDSGEIYVGGKLTEINNTNDAKANGLAMIFQEMSLVPTLSVVENIFLGNEITKNGVRDTRKMQKIAEEILAELGMKIDPATRVSDLSVGMCQMVEIAKAISKDAKILIFDEPSAALSDAETERLFEIIRQLKKKGVSMVYISHRMKEILEICDRVSVLKDGANVVTKDASELTIDAIISYMLGDTKNRAEFKWVPRDYDHEADNVLKVEDLHVNEKINHISFDLKPGQILGFAGLMGSGRTEIMETLFGLRKAEGGKVFLNGKEVSIKSSTDAVKNGLALVPEDRRREGLVLIHSIKENAILPIASSLVRHKVFNDDTRAKDIVSKNIDDLGIVTAGMNQRIGLLSGGNQQKVVIAKWLNAKPKIFMFDEPTAGVDVGAKGEILQIIRKYADEGGAVIFASSELSEMMAICDDIITLFDGHITGMIHRSDLRSEEELQNAIQKK